MEDLELTGTCPLITYTGSDEYQLPTQKHQEQLHKTTATQLDLNLKKFGSKNNFKVTDKILRLYNTPIEREIPFKRARSIAAKTAKNYQENLCNENELSFPNLENPNSKKSTHILQLSNNLVNDSLINGHKRAEQTPMVSVTTINDNSGASQLKMLDKIRPSHPQFAKEIKVNPEEALKINSLILAERSNVQLTPTAPPHKITFPSIESQANIATPKYWLNYLNQKIAKKRSTPSLHKMCKLCELNSEHGDIIKHSELGKDTLHIDLKRLTEIRSKNWSSYGHYTGAHKLKYTKRQNILLKSTAKQLEVDEDYLSVDVDKLMNIYEEKTIPDVMESNAAGGYIQTQQDADISNDIQRLGSAPERKAHSQASNYNQNVRNQGIKYFTCQEKYAALQRPTTTKLRSCINFTSRKTCFANVS